MGELHRVKIESDGVEERRSNVRLSRILAVALEAGGRELDCVAVDLSVTGFQVAVACELDPGQIVSARLHLARHSQVAVTAQVIWCDRLSHSMFRVGFQIEEVSSREDFERLCGYVEKERLSASGVPEGTTQALDLSTQISLRTMSDAEIERFSSLAKISEMLNSSTNLEELLVKALQIMVESTGAERGLILLDLENPDLDSPLFHTKADNENRGFSQSVVDRVKESRAPLLSLDAQRDERLSSSSSLRVMGTRSVLCVPIQSRDRDLGTIYLDNSIRAGALNQTDLKLATILAGMVVSAIERAEGFAELVQKEKLASIGTLTASFLHELSNPLTAILGLGEMLNSEVGGEMTQLLVDEARRCEHLVSDLLRFSRKESVEMTAVDLSDVVRKTVSTVAAESRLQKVDVRVDLIEGPSVLGSSGQLRQIVLNLLTNAIQAASHSSGGKVEIWGKPRLKDYLLVVADNGPGVPEGHLSKIFDPFFTTKGPGQGTGLGLSIIARIVNEHNGTVKAENRAGGGALFQVTLPLFIQPELNENSA
jgi:signal transduction histidine kinase